RDAGEDIERATLTLQTEGFVGRLLACISLSVAAESMDSAKSFLSFWFSSYSALNILAWRPTFPN
ncbi:hypothetical protein ACC717_37485, partial [Rhizobium ruizarguesonis]